MLNITTTSNNFIEQPVYPKSNEALLSSFNNSEVPHSAEKKLADFFSRMLYNSISRFQILN